MKKTIIALLVTIMILILVSVVMWQKGQMDQLKRNVTEIATIKQGDKVMKHVNNAERISGVKSIDDIWNQYINYEVGFKIKFPKETSWGELRGKSRIVEDGDVTYLVTRDYDYNKALDLKKSNKTVFEKANLIQPFTFLVQRVSNEQDLGVFIENALDDTMKLKSIVESDTEGVYDVYFEDKEPNIAGLGGPPLFTGRIIKYSPEKGLVAMWSNYGHEPTFPWEDENGESMTVRDGEVSDSFEFFDSYQAGVQNKDTASEIIIPATTETRQPSLRSIETESTSEWQVYQSRELEFEIKFPNNWRHIHRGEQGVMFGPKEVREDTLVTIIVLDEMPRVGDRTANSEVTRREDLTFAYLPAKRVYTKNLRMGLESSRIIVQKNGKFISVGESTLDNSDYPFNRSYNQTINKMLATFRFFE